MIKTTAKSLTEFPELNAIWDNGLQLKKDINIGFVVSLHTGGIIVPALHQVNLKTIDKIAEKRMIGVRSSVNVTLTGDYRATDRLTGSRFLVSLNKHLQNPEIL